MTLYRNTDIIQPGIYSAQLSSITQYQNKHGKRYAFKFILLDQQYRNRHITRTTSATMTPKSRLTETITNLSQGRKLHPTRFSKLIGTRCQLLIAQVKNRQGQVFSVVDRIFN